MAWSRLRARWRELLAPSVARRVNVHMAGYREAYERRGRAWLAIDGRPMATFCEFTFENAWRDQGRREGATDRPFTDSAHAAIREAGARDKADLLDALGTCIGQPVDALLASRDPLVRALARLDRRLGRRRLAKWEPVDEPDLVVALHRLRYETEKAARQRSP